MDNTNQKYSKRKKPDMSSLLYGKLPPQAPDLEGAVLGALMLEPARLYVVRSIIKSPFSFYADANQRIYASIIRLDQAGSKIDFMTVCEDLRKNSELEMVGGSYYVTQLTRDVVSSAHIEEHARIVMQKHILREIIRVSGESISKAYEDTSDVFDILKEWDMEFMTVKTDLISGKFRPMNTIMSKYLDDYYSPLSEKMILKSYIKSWDDTLGGNFQRGCLYIGAARPGMGKTSFAISISLLQSKHYKVGFWNGEITEKRLLNRYVANIGKIESNYLRNGSSGVSDEIRDKINMSAEELANHRKIVLNNDTNIDVFDLVSLIKYWVFVLGVEFVWLDYLRYIKLPDNPKYNYLPKEQKVDEILKILLQCAKDCDIPICLLTQLNRELLKLADKKPNLGHLRDSGAVEEIAYNVFFLHRPESYGEMEDEHGESTAGRVYLLTRKNGDDKNPTDIPLRHQLQYFSIFEEEELPPLLPAEIAQDLPF